MRISFVRTLPDVDGEFLQGIDIVVYEGGAMLVDPWCHVHTMNAETAGQIEELLGWKKLPPKSERITFLANFTSNDVLRKIRRLFPGIEIDTAPTS